MMRTPVHERTLIPNSVSTFRMPEDDSRMFESENTSCGCVFSPVNRAKQSVTELSSEGRRSPQPTPEPQL